MKLARTSSRIRVAAVLVAVPVFRDEIHGDWPPADTGGYTRANGISLGDPF